MPDTIDVKNASGSTITVKTNDALATLIGEVQASPTSNTLLDRLKSIAAACANLSQALDPVNDSLRAQQVYDAVVSQSGSVCTVKRARATISGTTAAQIVPNVTAKKILVLGYSLQVMASGTPIFNFQDDTGTPVVLSRRWQLDQAGTTGVNGVAVAVNPRGCGVDPTGTDKKLMGKLSAAVAVDVEVTYIEID